MTVTPTTATPNGRRANIYRKKAMSIQKGKTVVVVAPYGTVGSDDFKDHPVISGITGCPRDYRRYQGRP